MALPNFVKAVALPLAQLQIFTSTFHYRMGEAVRQSLRCPSIRRHFLMFSLSCSVFCPPQKITSSLGQDLSFFLPAKSWIRGPSSCNAVLKSLCGELGRVCAPQQKEGPSIKTKGGVKEDVVLTPRECHEFIPWW